MAAWAVLAIALALFGIGSGPAAADRAPVPTVQVSAPSTAAQGSTITLTATVTGDTTNGAPLGTVVFMFDGGTITPGVSLAPIDAATAQATLSYTISAALPSGPHGVTATYVPSDWTTGFPSAYASASTFAPAVINVSPVAPPPTAVQLTSDPNPVVPGRPATFTATVTALDGSATPTGTVTFDDNGTTTLGSVALVNGVATLSGVTGFFAGANVITATYTGNDAPSRTTLSFTLPTISVKFETTTTVTILPSPVIHPGDVVTAVATITRNGPGRAAPALVTFLVDGTPIARNAQVELGPDGTARTQIDSFQSGDHVVTASYVGSESDDASHGDAAVNVVPPGQPVSIGTQLAYGGDATAVFGDLVHLSATLTDAGGNPLAQEPVVLTLGSQSCTGTTGANGVATCTITVSQAPASYPVTVSFRGDGVYLASTTSSQLTVTPRATHLVYGGATTADYGDRATLSATLLDSSGSPIAGRTIGFTLGGVTCSGTSLPDGSVSCSVTITHVPGPTAVVVSFAGDTLYLGSSATPPFTVTRESTTATTSVSGPVASGAVVLSGVLLEDGTTPIAGRSVTLSLGTTSCTAVTTPAGLASCTVIPSVLGPATAGITFTGDGYYLPSTGTSQVLVYAPGFGGGMFVVGDGSATGGVSFWGAQWAKVNKVSHGPAPDAFKGFAAKPATRCGAGWSTGPGNSSDPPSGPLPSYMAVLVADSVTKTASTIAGSTVHIVIVKTDAGYKGDPGHAGTGTVVATVC